MDKYIPSNRSFSLLRIMIKNLNKVDFWYDDDADNENQLVRGFQKFETLESEYHFLDRFDRFIQPRREGRMQFRLSFGHDRFYEVTAKSNWIQHWPHQKFDLIGKMASMGWHRYGSEIMWEWIIKMRDEMKTATVMVGYPFGKSPVTRQDFMYEFETE